MAHKPSENIDLEGKYKLQEATDVEIKTLDEEFSYLGATAKSLLSHIRQIVTKLKVVDEANAETRAYPVVVEDARTLAADENTQGLSSCITLANSLKTVVNTHYADFGTGALTSAITLANALKATYGAHIDDAGGGGEEHTAILSGGGIVTPDATDLTTLIALTTEMLTDYAAHDVDAAAAVPTVHQAQAGANTLTSAAAPSEVHECVTRLNDLKAKLNLHMADATSHTAGDSPAETATDAAYVEEHIAEFATIATADATDLATLKTLIGAILTSYDSHDDDAELGSAWVYHIANEAGDATLASTVAPTTLAECITRTNDIKAKVNTHVADGTCHTAGDSGVESTADAAVGAGMTIAVTNAQSGDQVSWSILNDGTNNVTGVTAVAASGSVTFTFSGDPAGDTIVSYLVVRPSS